MQDNHRNLVRAAILSVGALVSASCSGAELSPSPSPAPERVMAPELEASRSYALELSITPPSSAEPGVELSWVLRDAGRRELGEGPLADSVARALELPGPDLYLLTVVSEDGEEHREQRVEIPVWITVPGAVELERDHGRDDERVAGSAVDPLWMRAWEISSGWQREIIPTHRAEGTAGLEALAARSRASIDAHPTELRTLLRFRWYAVFSGMVSELGSLLELRELAGPEAPVWAALGTRITVAHRREPWTPELAAVFEELAEENPAGSVRASARYSLLAAAERAGDQDEIQRWWRALDLPEYRGMEVHRLAAESHDPKHPLSPGRKLPELHVPELADEGATLVLGGAREKPQLVMVWSVYCHFCADEQPSWEAAHARFGDRVGFTSVSIDGEAEVVAEVRERWAMGWEHGLVDDEGFAELRERWGFDGVPMLVLVDEEGIILARGEELRGPKLTGALAAATGG